MKINKPKLDRELKRLGLTYSEFAKRAGITRQGLWAALNRRSTTTDTISKLGKALDIDPKDLLK